MFIGNIIKRRLKLLGVSESKFIKDCMLQPKFVGDIINNKVQLENIDNFDIEVLANVLYCTPEYFASEQVRQEDVMLSSFNRGEDTPKSNLAKAKIQQYMRDMVFIKEALN